MQTLLIITKTLTLLALTQILTQMVLHPMTKMMMKKVNIKTRSRKPSTTFRPSVKTEEEP